MNWLDTLGDIGAGYNRSQIDAAKMYQSTDAARLSDVQATRGESQLEADQSADLFNAIAEANAAKQNQAQSESELGGYKAQDSMLSMQELKELTANVAQEYEVGTEGFERELADRLAMRGRLPEATRLAANADVRQQAESILLATARARNPDVFEIAATETGELAAFDADGNAIALLPREMILYAANTANKLVIPNAAAVAAQTRATAATQAQIAQGTVGMTRAPQAARDGSASVRVQVVRSAQQQRNNIERRWRDLEGLTPEQKLTGVNKDFTDYVNSLPASDRALLMAAVSTARPQQSAPTAITIPPVTKFRDAAKGGKPKQGVAIAPAKALPPATQLPDLPDIPANNAFEPS